MSRFHITVRKLSELSEFRITVTAMGLSWYFATALFSIITGNAWDAIVFALWFGLVLVIFLTFMYWYHTKKAIG